jgi:hypothetical protein
MGLLEEIASKQSELRDLETRYAEEQKATAQQQLEDAQHRLDELND